jgi:hypothetical protein
MDSVSVKGSPFLGAFGWLLLVGLVMVGLAALLGFMMDLDEVAGEDVLPTVLRGFGVLAVAGALTAAGLFAHELAIGIRTALLIAGSYFLLMAAGISNVLRVLF